MIHCQSGVTSPMTWDIHASGTQIQIHLRCYSTCCSWAARPTRAATGELAAWATTTDTLRDTMSAASTTATCSTKRALVPLTPNHAPTGRPAGSATRRTQSSLVGCAVPRQRGCLAWFCTPPQSDDSKASDDSDGYRHSIDSKTTPLVAAHKRQTAMSDPELPVEYLRAMPDPKWSDNVINIPNCRSPC